MPLPEKVTIGPLVYTVTDDSVAFAQMVAEDLTSTWGYIRYGEGRIILNPNQNEAHKRMCLLHELLHGCWHMSDRDHSDDEKPILALAAPLVDMLRRNPDLVSYLLAED